MNKATRNKVQAFIEDISEELLKGDEVCSNTMNSVSHILASLLPLAAATGGVKTNPDFSVKQKMVYMGNKATVIAIEIVEETGRMDQLEALDSLADMLGDK